MTVEGAIYFSRFSPLYSKAISNAIKELIENHHLYQNYEFVYPSKTDLVDALAYTMAGATSGYDQFNDPVEEMRRSAPNYYWRICDRGNPLRNTPNSTSHFFFEFEPASIKVFCSNCDRQEPFNIIHGEDFTQKFERDYRDTSGSIVQNFALAYECQSCRGFPEMFLIRRNADKLSVCGRSPIERLPVLKIIPKEVRKFYSDAHLAFNSGQVLAANFLLRTSVEQFLRVRTKLPESKDVSQLLDDYAASLDEDFKGRFPSLKNIYEVLSLDIHNAEGSEDVFLDADSSIREHFDARRVYKLE